MNIDNIFIGGFRSETDIETAFEADKCLDNCIVHLAVDEYASYEGHAFILFQKKEVLYEVNAHHCSCDGYEGQWDPEEVTADDLIFRLKNGKIINDCVSMILENMVGEIDLSRTRPLSEKEQKKHDEDIERWNKKFGLPEKQTTMPSSWGCI